MPQKRSRPFFEVVKKVDAATNVNENRLIRLFAVVDEPLRFENWAQGHPKAFLHSLRDCVRMRRKSGWRWHETPCSALKWKYRFICQYGAYPGNQHALSGWAGPSPSTLGKIGKSKVCSFNHKFLHLLVSHFPVGSTQVPTSGSTLISHDHALH